MTTSDVEMFTSILDLCGVEYVRREGVFCFGGAPRVQIEIESPSAAALKRVRGSTGWWEAFFFKSGGQMRHCSGPGVWQ